MTQPTEALTVEEVNGWEAWLRRAGPTATLTTEDQIRLCVRIKELEAEKTEILEYARAKTGQLEFRCQELENDRDNWRAKAGG